MSDRYAFLTPFSMRRMQKKIPNKSEAIRIVVERAIRAEAEEG